MTPLTIRPHTVLDRDIKSRTTSTTSTMSMVVSIKLPSLLNCCVRETLCFYWHFSSCGMIVVANVLVSAINWRITRVAMRKTLFTGLPTRTILGNCR